MPTRRRQAPTRGLGGSRGIRHWRKSPADFVKVARTNEVEPGPARLVAVKSREIALFNIDGQFLALANACTHENGASAEGEIWDREVTCPLHGATFDIRQGEVLTPPAYEAVAAYRVRVTEPTSRSRFRDQR